jgi:hypothetical protein
MSYAHVDNAGYSADEGTTSFVEYGGRREAVDEAGRRKRRHVKDRR